jgi:hypothetical protein
MKTLAAMLMVSMSGLCSQSDVAAKTADAVSDSSVQSAPVAKSTPEWCTCALTVEETIFLQQYDSN